MSIEVTVDGDGTPTCTPATKSKAKGSGKLTWHLKTAGYDFTGLQFDDPQPAAGIFTNKTVLANKITMDDNNPGGGSAVDYPYTIGVAASASKPVKGARLESGRLGSGSAVIRNEPT